MTISQDDKPEPKPLLAGVREQGDKAPGAPAGLLAEPEVRAGVGLRPGPPAAAAGPPALARAFRTQLSGHVKSPAAFEQVAGQESEWREVPAAVQVALADETQRRRRRGGEVHQEQELEQKEERRSEGTLTMARIFQISERGTEASRFHLLFVSRQLIHNQKQSLSRIEKVNFN